MRGFELTIATYEGTEADSPVVVKKVAVNFRPQEDGKHKPLVSVKNADSGIELKFDLPAGDYSNLNGLMERVSSAGLNPDAIEKVFQKILLLLKFIR